MRQAHLACYQCKSPHIFPHCHHSIAYEALNAAPRQSIIRTRDLMQAAEMARLTCCQISPDHSRLDGRFLTQSQEYSPSSPNVRPNCRSTTSYRHTTVRFPCTTSIPCKYCSPQRTSRIYAIDMSAVWEYWLGDSEKLASLKASSLVHDFSAMNVTKELLGGDTTRRVSGKRSRSTQMKAEIFSCRKECRYSNSQQSSCRSVLVCILGCAKDTYL